MYSIFTHIWLIFMVNVGKDASPMDASWVIYHQDFRQQYHGYSTNPP